jgi:hypothetical protein
MGIQNRLESAHSSIQVKKLQIDSPQSKKSH